MLTLLDKQSLPQIDRQDLTVHLKIEKEIANLFYGLSLGSILLLAALGLAITVGLMGVINMAHGEMLMIGAYAKFVIQNLFVKNHAVKKNQTKDTNFCFGNFYVH